jgi:hypothetical protein
MFNTDDVLNTLRNTPKLPPRPTIVETLTMVDTVQCKKHKKPRINKKWKKRYGFSQIPKQDIYYFDDKLICHPVVANRIRKLLMEVHT